MRRKEGKIKTHKIVKDIQTSATSRRSPDMGRKGIYVSRLQVDRSGANESTGKTFARTKPGDDAARCDSLDLVLAIPSHQMTIIDEVGLAIGDLDQEQ